MYVYRCCVHMDINACSFVIIHPTMWYSKYRKINFKNKFWKKNICRHLLGGDIRLTDWRTVAIHRLKKCNLLFLFLFFLILLCTSLPFMVISFIGPLSHILLWWIAKVRKYKKTPRELEEENILNTRFSIPTLCFCCCCEKN